MAEKKTTKKKTTKKVVKKSNSVEAVKTTEEVVYDAAEARKQHLARVNAPKEDNSLEGLSNKRVKLAGQLMIIPANKIDEREEIRLEIEALNKKIAEMKVEKVKVDANGRSGS